MLFKSHQDFYDLLEKSFDIKSHEIGDKDEVISSKKGVIFKVIMNSSFGFDIWVTVFTGKDNPVLRFYNSYDGNIVFDTEDDDLIQESVKKLSQHQLREIFEKDHFCFEYKPNS